MVERGYRAQLRILVRGHFGILDTSLRAHSLALIHLCQRIREIEQEGLRFEATEEEELGLGELDRGEAETLVNVRVVRDLQEAPTLILEVSRVWALPEESEIQEFDGVPCIFLYAREDI